MASLLFETMMEVSKHGKETPSSKAPSKVLKFFPKGSEHPQIQTLNEFLDLETLLFGYLNP